MNEDKNKEPKRSFWHQMATPESNKLVLGLVTLFIIYSICRAIF